MSLPKVGLNLSGLGNVSPVEFDINTTVEGFLEEMPRRANNLTGGYFGLAILIFNTIYLYKILADKSQYGLFRYSRLRAAGICTGISGIIGLIMLNIGYFVNLYHVVIFITVFLIISIWVGKSER